MVNPKIRDELNDRLCQAVLKLETVDEAYQFFEDLCTVSEMKAMAQRLEVARMLQDKVTYDVIVESTGASTATISRVKRCLNYGADGYSLVFDRLSEEKEMRSGDKTAKRTAEKNKSAETVRAGYTVPKDAAAAGKGHAAAGAGLEQEAAQPKGRRGRPPKQPEQ